MYLFLPALTILFIALKLTQFIDWSWWFVLLPLYGPILAVCLAVYLAALVYLIYDYLFWRFASENQKSRRRVKIALRDMQRHLRK